MIEILKDASPFIKGFLGHSKRRDATHLCTLKWFY